MKVGVYHVATAAGQSAGCNMNGVSSDQTIWCTVDGNTSTVSLSTLMSAYNAGQLHRYRPYTMNGAPTDPCTPTSIGEVIDNGTALMMQLTTIDEETLIIPADGAMLDIFEWDPIHYTVNFPGNARYFVGTRSGIKAKKRNIAKYEIVGSGSVYTLPLTNFLTSGYAIVLG